MKFSTVAAALALSAATASAATIRDAPNSVTYYFADHDQTCTFTQGAKDATCSPGRIGNAQDLPDDLKATIEWKEPENGTAGGPGNFRGCSFGCHWGFFRFSCGYDCN